MLKVTVKRKIISSVVKHWKKFATPVKEKLQQNFWGFFSKNKNLDCYPFSKTLMNSKTIERRREFKYLGTVLERELKFTEHVQYLINELNSFLSSFYRLQKILTCQQLLLCYKSYVQTVIQYAVLIYGAACKIALDPLELRKYICWELCLG